MEVIMGDTTLQTKNSELLNELVTQISQGIVVIDLAGSALSINPAFTALTGYRMEDLRIGLLDSNSPLKIYQNHDLYDALIHHFSWKGEMFLTKSEGDVCSLYVETLPIGSAPDAQNTILIFREIHPLAYIDALTNLPNRRCFHECLHSALANQNPKENILALLYVDLDRFKFVNDTLGHVFGDLLLIEAANRMHSCLGDGESLARVGGDEFICLIPIEKDTKKAEAIAQDIINILAQPFLIQNHEIYLTASIGITFYPHDGDTSEALVTNADSAMYNAKRLGKNRVEWFKAEIQASGYERLILENSLRKAIQNEELYLVYQPLFDSHSGEIASVEALIRWEHPDYGTISPGDFIPIAEESGLILQIGTWVIREACRQNCAWQQQGLSPIRVAVNLSSEQLAQPQLPDLISEILHENQMEAKWLEIEITESMILKDINATTNILKKLKQMGIHVSIDDFGTGYSSLSYLGKLPIDILKIDRSFIKDIESDNSASIVTGAIVSLAHSLDLRVVAEGVETQGQLKEVRKRNCDVIQGYLFSKPLISEDLTKYLFERGTFPC
jgi:diguanylate cyclase (GGDEF)-like protein/PAS domain S-box-containing protein